MSFPMLVPKANSLVCLQQASLVVQVGKIKSTVPSMQWWFSLTEAMQWESKFFLSFIGLVLPSGNSLHRDEIDQWWFSSQLHWWVCCSASAAVQDWLIHKLCHSLLLRRLRNMIVMEVELCWMLFPLRWHFTPKHSLDVLVDKYSF